MLADCKVLLVAKIGPMPAAKLGNAGIEAIDAHVGKPIETALTEVFADKTLPQSDEPIDTSAFRLAHAMLRVSDIERSIDFYTRLLGMKVLEQRDHKKNQFTQVYVGYGDGFSQMVLELVFNWMQEEPYAKGDAFGHIAIQVTGINRLCNRLAAEGVPMPRAPAGPAPWRQHHRFHRRSRRPPHRAVPARRTSELDGCLTRSAPADQVSSTRRTQCRRRLHHPHARRQALSPPG